MSEDTDWGERSEKSDAAEGNSTEEEEGNPAGPEVDEHLPEPREEPTEQADGSPDDGDTEGLLPDRPEGGDPGVDSPHDVTDPDATEEVESAWGSDESEPASAAETEDRESAADKPSKDAKGRLRGSARARTTRSADEPDEGDDGSPDRDQGAEGSRVKVSPGEEPSAHAESGADDAPSGDGTERLGFGDGEPTDQYGPGMGPSDLDRAFSILERAFSSEALGGQQLDQLLTVFEDVFTSGESDPEAMAELISLLEEVIIQPSDLGQVDVSGILSIIEEAVSETTRADREDIADVMAVLEEGLLDPTGIEPEDVERFHAGLENAILDLTDPNTTGLGGLFAIPERIAEETGVEAEYGDEVDLFRIARVAAGMTQRATGYTMESGIRTGTRMAYAAANSQSPAELLTNTRAIALDELQRAGIDIGEEQQHWLELHEDELIDTRPLTRESLAERGEELLQASAEIGRDESVHPSYPMVLEQLASDEARMLRLIAREGPQGVVDVYARRYIPFSLYPVAQDMTMLGADAGCRYKQRTPVYVQNLQRLGLVRITDQPIPNPKDYQVLEAQPHVEAARDSVRRPRIAYKRIELTAFGIEFCEMCFPFEVRIDSPRLEFRAENET